MLMPLVMSERLRASRLGDDLGERGAQLEGVQELDDVVLFLLREIRSGGGADIGAAGSVGVPDDFREEVAVSPREGELLRAVKTSLGRFS